VSFGVLFTDRGVVYTTRVGAGENFLSGV